MHIMTAYIVFSTFERFPIIAMLCCGSSFPQELAVLQKKEEIKVLFINKKSNT